MSKHIYFASDFHLGVDTGDDSLIREKKVVRWLDQIKDSAEEIYFMGDVFDYWFEYGSVIPKGFSHLFGKIRELREAGISMHFFIGNHDMWMFKYMEEEYGIPIYRKPVIKKIQGKIVYLAHGDGLGPGDLSYKFIKTIFNNKLCQWLYARVHPNAGLWIMRRFSHQSRKMTSEEEKYFILEKERTITFSEQYIKDHKIDYFVMGHRHLPIQYILSNNKSEYINIGDWIHHYSYGKMTNGKINVEFFENENSKVYGNK